MDRLLEAIKPVKQAKYPTTYLVGMQMTVLEKEGKKENHWSELSIFDSSVLGWKIW